ncbi:LysR family transcriptional regulator [Marinagarivorans cellulosilyticus]|uniref:LysR family transcriptional regulator n=1 Tax=Marinagarivorans cellulosilyticus TaxID=2721545 RepID=UPI00308451F4
MVDIDTLRAFVIISECGSFSLAAEKLFITQPAVSKRINALESLLDTRLFDRIGKQVQLTEGGQILLPKAQRILADIQDAATAVKDLSGEVRGDLHVATSHHIGLHKLPPVLRDFAERYPKVNLRFEFLDSEVACERVLQGKCELALVTLPPQIDAPLAATAIWHDPLVFITSRQSAIAADCTLAELSQTPAILPDLNTYTGQLIHRFFNEQGLNLNISMATNFLETIKMLCSVGLGWSVLPASMLDEQLKVLNVQSSTLKRDLGLVRHTGRTLSNAGQAFIARLNDTTPKASKL